MFILLFTIIGVTFKYFFIILLKVYSNRDIFISYQANIIVCAKLYKASLWNDVRMPLGKKNEDEYVTWKIYYKAHKIAVSTVPLYYYFSNPESIMSSNSTFLNLYYIGAYNERINFFKSVNDVDMLIMSQIQFCKELSLSYFKMRELNEKEKAKYVHDIYSNNVLDIMNSPLLTMSLRFYFRIFNFSPKLAYLCLKIIKQYK